MMNALSTQHSACSTSSCCNPRAIRSLLIATRTQADDIERRLARMVAGFHRAIFNARYHGGPEPIDAVRGLGRQAGQLFAAIELACRALRDFDKLTHGTAAGFESSDAPRATAVPADWSYTIHADGTVTLHQPPAPEPIDLTPMPPTSTTDGEGPAVGNADRFRRASAG